MFSFVIFTSWKMNFVSVLKVTWINLTPINLIPFNQDVIYEFCGVNGTKAKHSC